MFYQNYQKSVNFSLIFKKILNTSSAPGAPPPGSLRGHTLTSPPLVSLDSHPLEKILTGSNEL